MEAKEFYDMVVQMREHQKDFFQTRSKTSMEKAKFYEKRIDAEIKRVEAKLAEEQRKAQLEEQRQTRLDI